MGIAAIIGIVSVVGNLILGFATLWQRSKKQRVSEKLELVGQGLQLIEDAIEENKGLVDGIDAGRKITSTIKKYGPIAESAVDAARDLAHNLGK